MQHHGECVQEKGEHGSYEHCKIVVSQIRNLKYCVRGGIFTMEQKRHTTIQLGLYYNSIPNRK